MLVEIWLEGFEDRYFATFSRIFGIVHDLKKVGCHVLALDRVHQIYQRKVQHIVLLKRKVP